MSMVSRRVFLKCIGVGSAAVASAALMGGCSGGDVPVSSGNVGNASGGNQNSNNSNSSSASNSTNSSASSSSESSSSSEASSENTVTSGDIGKGYLYRPMNVVPESERAKNGIVDQDVGIALEELSGDSWFNEDKTIDTAGMFRFYIYNGGNKVKVPLENPWEKFTKEEEADFYGRGHVLQKFKSKYIEVRCDSKIVSAGVLSGDSYAHSPLLVESQGVAIYVRCNLPEGWKSATVKFRLPHAPDKYANFIVYPSDVV